MFNKELNAQLDANGAEEVQAATNPNWWTGTGREIARGAGNVKTFFERQAGAMDSTAADALGVNRYIQRDGTVAQIHDIKPADPATLPKYEKPDPRNSGAAAIFMGDLFQSAPALAATAVNPLLGGSLAAGMAADRYAQEADERGLKGNARTGFIALHALEEGIGAALPGVGGIGDRALIKYGSRFLVGGTINEGVSEAGNYSRAALLDKYGYHGQAVQMRDWDFQAAAANFVMGGVFNLAGGHSRAGRAEQPVLTAAPEAVPSAGAPAENVPAAQPAPSLSTSPVQAAQLTRLEVKQAKSDIANAERHLTRIDTERTTITGSDVKGSGKQLAEGRRQRSAQLAELDKQRQFSEQLRQNAQERLDAHEAFNRQRITPEQADASTHTALHDNYVTESAPGLATDVVSEAAHVRAMDSAMEAIHTGRAVDVSAHFDHDTGLIVTSADLDAGPRDRADLSGNIIERTNAAVDAANAHSMPSATTGEPVPGQISPNIAQPFDLLRTQAETLRATHPELADVVATHINDIEVEHQRAHAEASQYDIAAACAIVHGA